MKTQTTQNIRIDVLNAKWNTVCFSIQTTADLIEIDGVPITFLFEDLKIKSEVEADVIWTEYYWIDKQKYLGCDVLHGAQNNPRHIKKGSQITFPEHRLGIGKFDLLRNESCFSEDRKLYEQRLNY